MAALKLDPADRYAEIDLVEDSTVDAADQDRLVVPGRTRRRIARRSDDVV